MKTLKTITCIFALLIISAYSQEKKDKAKNGEAGKIFRIEDLDMDLSELDGLGDNIQASVNADLQAAFGTESNQENGEVTQSEPPVLQEENAVETPVENQTETSSSNQIQIPLALPKRQNQESNAESIEEKMAEVKKEQEAIPSNNEDNKPQLTPLVEAAAISADDGSESANQETQAEQNTQANEQAQPPLEPLPEQTNSLSTQNENQSVTPEEIDEVVENTEQETQPNETDSESEKYKLLSREQFRAFLQSRIPKQPNFGKDKYCGAYNGVGFCSFCFYTYYDFFKKRCAKPAVKVEHCVFYANPTRCMQCDFGYTLQPKDNKCVKNNVEHCKVEINGKCTVKFTLRLIRYLNYYNLYDISFNST